MRIVESILAAHQSARIKVFSFILTLAIIALMIELSYHYTVNLIAQAHRVTLQSIANQLSLASAINLISRSADKSKGIAIHNCQDVLKLMDIKPSYPNEYLISSAVNTPKGEDCSIRFLRENIEYHFYSNKIS